MPDDLLVTVKAKVASDDAMTMMSASETRSLLRALVVRCEQAEADLAALQSQRCETCVYAHLTEQFRVCQHADIGLFCSDVGNRCGRWTALQPGAVEPQ